MKTGCPYCGVGCGLVAEVRDGRLTAVRGDEAHPVNRGRTCRKPLALPEASRSGDRALKPPAAPLPGRALPRRDLGRGARPRRHPPAAVQAGGDRVLHLRPVADRGLLRGQQARQGLPGDEQRRLQLAPVHVVAPSPPTTRRSAPTARRPPTTTSSWRARSCCWAATPAPVTRSCGAASARRRSAGATLIVVDPRRTDSAAVADIHLQIKPGTDLALLNAFIAGARARGRLGRRDRAAEAAACRRSAIERAARAFADAPALHGAVVDGRQPVRRGRRDQPRAAEPVRRHRPDRPSRAPARCR